jgi:hypothetical protein
MATNSRKPTDRDASKRTPDLRDFAAQAVMRAENVETRAAEPRPLNDGEIALLAELARALLPTHGAQSVDTVKRAADKTRNLREIITLLAHDIADESKRAAFMRRAKVAVHSHREQKRSEPPQPSGFTNRRTTQLTAEMMTSAEEIVAPFLGSQAGILVARYASSTDNSRDFFDQLASHLRTPQERKMLFRAARRGKNAGSASVG